MPPCARLRLVNAPLGGAAPRADGRRRRRRTRPPRNKSISALAGIDDPALREALAGLGRALLDTAPQDAKDKPAGR